jgi:SAM-dependent MidA family methyltransferase
MVAVVTVKHPKMTRLSGHGTVTTVPDWSTWRDATEQALYGPHGFYRRPEGATGHFRTSVATGTWFARALVRLADEVDAALGRPDTFTIVDLGAARGELLATLDAVGLDPRWRLHGVDVVPRPPLLPAGAEWSGAVPTKVTGLIVANEWLDDLPVDVVERAPDGVRQVLVNPATGEEMLGPLVDEPDAAWLTEWWPLSSSGVGDRAEVGRPRDTAWSSAVGALARGVAIAIDYSHELADRAGGMLSAGTLAGYVGGRLVPPIPDGSCDVTSHVALDACAAAGERSGASASLLVRQREALHALGVNGQRPGRDLAERDPSSYLRELTRTSEAAELVQRGGLGDFGWLVQCVGVPLPPSLAALTD